MYSRSYGLIEQGDQNGVGFSVPPDYNGNLYRKTEKKDERTEKPREAPRTEPLPRPEEKTPSAPSGIAGGFLERLTAEDILLFIFLYSLIRGDAEDNGNILGLILALLLL